MVSLEKRRVVMKVHINMKMVIFLLFMPQLVTINACAQPPYVIGEPVDRPGIVVPGTVGTKHTVSGSITDALNCAESLSDKKIFLVRWYMLPDGNDWNMPRKNYNWLIYGYDRLVLKGHDLKQGKSVGASQVDVNGHFEITWKQFIPENRTPFISDVYHVSENTIDPTEPLGFRRITVREVFALVMNFTDESESNYGVVFSPRVHLDFYGNETEKLFPPLTATCVYIPEG